MQQPEKNSESHWDLLKQHLEVWGPGYYTAEKREEWFFTNRSNKPGDDMKDEVREDEADEAWQLWTAEWNRMAQLRQQGPALVFPSEEEVLDRIFSQVRHEKGLMALCYRGPHQ